MAPSPEMSAKRKSIQAGVAAVALAILIIAGATYFVGSPGKVQVASQGQSSLLVIQLTDPPTVPAGTTSLNMTYSSLSLLVGEPSGSGTQTISSVTINLPPPGTATLDLLKLQNISQTVGSASLPAGSVVYSVSFTVKEISINVSGTVSSVSLATGNTLNITLANVPTLQGTNLALLRLDPVVVNTPNGYTLIPSAVGVLRTGEGVGEGAFGYSHNLSSNDQKDLEDARGYITANLTELSVTGTTSTIVIQVNNTGTAPVDLNAIGINGNFTTSGACANGAFSSTFTHTEDTGNEAQFGCGPMSHPVEVVFEPVVGGSGGTTCASQSMQLVNNGQEDSHGKLTLAPGECVDLTYSGTISFGASPVTLTPSTLNGQMYEVHVIASNGGNFQMACTLPVGPNSCTPTRGSDQ